MYRVFKIVYPAYESAAFGGGTQGTQRLWTVCLAWQCRSRQAADRTDTKTLSIIPYAGLAWPASLEAWHVGWQLAGPPSVLPSIQADHPAMRRPTENPPGRNFFMRSGLPGPSTQFSLDRLPVCETTTDQDILHHAVLLVTA